MSLQGTPVLLTGGTGFLGSHLARRLVAEGAHVTLTVRDGSSTGRIDDIADGVRFVEADVTDAASLERCVAKSPPRIVLHLAARASGRSAADDPDAWRESLAVNAKGTLNLMLALRSRAGDVTRIVRTGGMEEYGDGTPPFREDDAERVVSPYSAGQVAATLLSRAMAERWGLPLVTLRPSLVYGPAQDPSFFLPGLIAACRESRDFEMTSGEQTTDLVYVDDVVDALILGAMTDGAGGEIFNVGSGVETRVRDLAEMVVARTRTKAKLEIGAVPRREREPDRRFLDVTKAERVLGWKARVSLEDGLDRTIAWFRRDR